MCLRTNEMAECGITEFQKPRYGHRATVIGRVILETKPVGNFKPSIYPFQI